MTPTLPSQSRSGKSSVSVKEKTVTAEYRPKAIASASIAKRKEHIAEASQAHLSGRRAEAWLREWDKGVKASRMHALEAFVGLHQESNCCTMEADLGDAAPLLFTRILSWFRLSYKALKEKKSGGGVSSSQGAPSRASPSVSPANSRGNARGFDSRATSAEKRTTTPAYSTGTRSTGKPGSATDAMSAQQFDGAVSGSRLMSTVGNRTPLLLTVQAMIIFSRGASYMTQLVEAGIAGALTDCLECGTQPHSLTIGTGDTASAYRLLTLEERRHVVLLLLYLSNGGRVYREMICEEEGLVHMFHALQREETEEMCLMMTELFIQLGQGNPRIAPLIHNGLVRLILCHCRRRGATGRVTDATKDGGSSCIAEAEREISRRLASYSGLERTVSDHVAFHAARALHFLQITAEEHHFAQCQSGKALPGVHVSVDMVPVVGLRLNATASSTGMETYTASDPLIADLSYPEFLDALLYLTLHDNTRFRVEGSELLALAAKNIQLTRSILSRCFEVLDDDILNITDEDDIERITRRQRLQLSCGRAAVQVILSKPMSDERKSLIMKFVALHGAHISLLKYLRLSDSGDSAAVHDCCRALQIIARASHAQQRMELQHVHLKNFSPLLQVGQIIRDAIGDSLYQALLHDELTEEESFDILRSAKTTKLLSRRSIIEENNFTPEKETDPGAAGSEAAVTVEAENATSAPIASV